MLLNISDKCAPNNTKMFVTSVAVRKKKHFYMYCNTFQSYIVRHFEKIHGNKLEVQKFKDILKETAKRKQS